MTNDTQSKPAAAPSRPPSRGRSGGPSSGPGGDRRPGGDKRAGGRRPDRQDRTPEFAQKIIGIRRVRTCDGRRPPIQF